MGDPYRIRIPAEIDAVMSAWNLPADIKNLLDLRLHEQLADDPVRHLIRAIAPWGDILNLYGFTLADAERASVAHMFQFHVLYSDDEKTLDIVDVGYQRMDREPPPLTDQGPAPIPG